MQVQAETGDSGLSEEMGVATSTRGAKTPLERGVEAVEHELELRYLKELKRPEESEGESGRDEEEGRLVPLNRKVKSTSY